MADEFGILVPTQGGIGIGNDDDRETWTGAADHVGQIDTGQEWPGVPLPWDPEESDE